MIFLVFLLVCPGDMWINGVRPDGRFECRFVPMGDDSIGARGEIDRSFQPSGSISGRILCFPGTHPIIVDSHHAECR